MKMKLLMTLIACFACSLFLPGISPVCHGQLAKEEIAVDPDSPGPTLKNRCCRFTVLIRDPQESCYKFDANGVDKCDTMPDEPSDDPLLNTPRCDNLATAQETLELYDSCEQQQDKTCKNNAVTKWVYPKKGKLSCPMTPNDNGDCACKFDPTEGNQPTKYRGCLGDKCTKKPPKPKDPDAEVIENIENL